MSENGRDSVDGEIVWDAIGTIRELTASATSFCRVCMRAAPEEKLVPPHSIAALSNMLHLYNLWRCGEPPCLVCVWCEAAARAALRVVGALRAADAAHVVAAANRRTVSKRTAAKVNARATQERPRRLRTTEILSIVGNEMQPPSQHQAPRKPRPAPSLPAWRGDMQTVVIDDDDDDPLTPPRSHVRPSGSTGPPTGSTASILHQTLTQPLIITPSVSHVPSSVCVTPITLPLVSQLAVSTSGIAITQLPQIVPMNIIMNNSGVQHMLLVQDQGMNGVSPKSMTDLDVQKAKDEVVLQEALVRMNQSSKSMTTAMIDLDVQENKKEVLQEAVIKMSQDLHGHKRKRTNSEKEIQDNALDIPLCVVTNVMGGVESPPRKARGPKTKQPERIAGKVDWEDKIPMDVISFMDATDPRAEQLFVPDHCPPPTGRENKQEPS